MTSNGVASSAMQALATTPLERVSEHAASRAVKEVVHRDKEPVAQVVDRPEQVPAQVYNSKGQLVPAPSTSGTDFRA